MQKIVLPIDAFNFDPASCDFACYLANGAGSKVSGLLLQDHLDVKIPVIKKIHGMSYAEAVTDHYSEEYRDKMKLVHTTIDLFNTACISRDARHSIINDEVLPSEDLTPLTRFTDLVVISPFISFQNRVESMPTSFLKELLKAAECPVIVAPETFERIDELIFTCDGSASSMFAMKQFTYQLPQFSNKKVTVFHVNQSGQWNESDQQRYQEWLGEHYSTIHFEAARGEPNSKLFDHFQGRKNIFIVMGAYGRNEISQMISRSHAEILIKTTNQPIFIAHGQKH